MGFGPPDIPGEGRSFLPEPAHQNGLKLFSRKEAEEFEKAQQHEGEIRAGRNERTRLEFATFSAPLRLHPPMND